MKDKQGKRSAGFAFRTLKKSLFHLSYHTARKKLQSLRNCKVSWIPLLFPPHPPANNCLHLGTQFLILTIRSGISINSKLSHKIKLGNQFKENP